jgi:hypothetical protein
MVRLSSPPSSTLLPKCVRLPKSGAAEPYSGLRRTQLDLLVRPQPGNNYDPPVKSHILAARGNSRGVRLIDLQSLLTHIERLPSEQPKKATTKRRRAK